MTLPVSWAPRPLRGMATILFRNCHSRPPLCHQSELRGHVWELEGLRWVLAPSPLPRRYWGFRSLESYAPHYPFLLHHHRDHKIMPPAAWLERDHPGKHLWKALAPSDIYSNINFQKFFVSLNSPPASLWKTKAGSHSTGLLEVTSTMARTRAILEDPGPQRRP